MNQKVNVETPSVEKIGELDKDKMLMQRAFRWPKFGMAERLVARHLLIATCTNTKSAILQNVCRAAMKVETLLGNKQKIKGVDFKLLKDLYSIDGSINSPETIKFDPVYADRKGWTYKKLFRVHWNFETKDQEGRENFEKLAKPWFKGVSCWMQFLKLCKQQRLVAECPKCSFALLDESTERLDEIIKDEKDLSLVLFGLYGKTENVPFRKMNPKFARSGEPVLITGNLELRYVVCGNCGHEMRVKQKGYLKEVFRPSRGSFLSSNPNKKLLEKLGNDDTLDSLKWKETESVDWKRPWAVFYEVTWFLREGGLHDLQESFYNWAVPICEEASVRLSQLVSPETMRDIGRLMSIEQGKGEMKTEDSLATGT